ncbi:MAG TPA: HAMP domain-containing histidine kinase [Candidatus Corynebacterium avicola]|uniref:histidine kinase n=1 Tax=Candidatus Corynebacterium avicola TaxID=2838527 RepID=A0A9D1RS20_9CORY|nr:HAMP domain-containing histidine kinase [Candidatus Corynebacterium avicola]
MASPSDGRAWKLGREKTTRDRASWGTRDKPYPGVFLSHYPLRVSLVLVIAVLTALGLTVSGTVITGMTQRFLTDRVDEELSSNQKFATEQTRSSCDRELSANDYLDLLGNGPSTDMYWQIVGDPCADESPNNINDSKPDVSALDKPTSPVTVPPTSDSASSSSWRAAAVVNDEGEVVVFALPMDSETKIMNQMTTMLVTISLLILAVLIGASMFLVRRALQPLYHVEQTAGRIARGHLDQRVPNWSPRTEVGRLSVALNRMLAQIQGAFIAVNESERQAREAESSMRRFIGDASHELRTPLTSVRGYADLYRSGATNDPDMVVDRISDEAGRMSLLVEDLLTLVRMDEGRPMREDPVDLLELSLSAAENARAGFPGRVVRVQNDTRSVPVTVGDSARLHQVVGNLVTNALRHAGEDATVDIRLSRVDGEGDGISAADGASGDGESVGMIALDISDDGTGIAPKDVPHLFERFYRADVSRSRASGGSGLGLSIVQRLVERHNGTITVESELGEGTTFHIRLPAWKDEGLDESFDDFEGEIDGGLEGAEGPEEDGEAGEIDGEIAEGDGQDVVDNDEADSASSSDPDSSDSSDSEEKPSAWTDKRAWGDRRNPDSWGR